MSKFQIEKVDHSPSSELDQYFLTSYYPASDKLVQTNFATKKSVYESVGQFQTGIWRVKHYYEDSEYLNFLDEMSYGYNHGIGYL